MTLISNRTEKKPVRQDLRQKSTHTEEILWRKLKDRRLAGFKFRRQHSLGRYIADFYCPQAKLVIEIDGGIHDNAEARDYDKIRDDFIRELDIKILRFTNEEVQFELEKVLQVISRSVNHVSTET